MNTINPTDPRTWKVYILTRDVTNPEGDGRSSSWSRSRTWKAGEKVITRDGRRAFPWGLRHERAVPLEVFEGSLMESTARERLDTYLILYDLKPDNIIDQMLSQGKISMSDIRDACIERAQIYARAEAEDMQKLIGSIRARNAEEQAKQNKAEVPEKDRKNIVLFHSAFRHESSPNISHATLDGQRTLCRRTGWATEEGWTDPPIVGCIVCHRALKRAQRKSEQT